MGRAHTISDVFRNASGSNPSEWKKGGALGPREIESLRGEYLNWANGDDDLRHPPDELWPLISHHDDVDANVVLRNFIARPEFSSRKDPMDELAAHLTACNGVVLADPLRRIFFDVDGHEVANPRSADIHRVADRIGVLEAPIDKGLVLISKVHPTLSSSERQAFIAPFNLGPNMRTLLDLIQEGIWLPSRPVAEQQLFPHKVRQLMDACGIRDSDLPIGVSPHEQTMRFARTLMEVSWQLAHVVASGADLYLTTPLEWRVFEVLVEDCADTLRGIGVVEDAPYQEGRHVQLLASVGLPALDAKKLSFEDVIDIRSDDVFSTWRRTLNRALDTYSSVLNDRGEKTAVAVFRTEIGCAADELKSKASSRSLRHALKDVVTVTPFVIAASGFTEHLTNGSVAATGLAATATGMAADKFIKYLTNRQRPADKAALRFLAAFQSP